MDRRQFALTTLTSSLATLAGCKSDRSEVDAAVVKLGSHITLLMTTIRELEQRNWKDIAPLLEDLDYGSRLVNESMNDLNKMLGLPHY